MVAVSLGLGWQLRWALDDAFISFRYSWNLVHGYGLVFNPGEVPPVEGYTNFLWTLLMAVPIALGLDALHVSFLLTLLFGGVTLVLTWRLARSILRDEKLGVLATLLLGLNFTFVCFLTSGMETSLQTCLITGCLLLAVQSCTESWTRIRAAGLSLCAAAAVLTRLDSAVPIVVAGGMLIPWLGWKRATAWEMISRLAWLILPGGVVVGIWVVWKLGYYGELLPNTWYARETGLDASIQWSRGLRFVGGFLRVYWFWPLLALSVFLVPLWRKRTWGLLTGSLVAWCAYVAGTGADYMEYRFMVPLLPALCVVSVVAAARVHRFAAPVVVAGLIAASIAHGVSNPGTPIGHGRLGPGFLAPKEFPQDNHWSRLGDLIRTYPGGDKLLWTIPALGVSGYYSRFQLVDLHGLTDRWVARHGRVRNESPGHDKYAPLSYLEQRGVALAFSFQDPCYWYAFYSPEELGTRQLVEINGALFLYITPNPIVDRVVADRGARYHFPPPEDCPDQQAMRRAKELRPTASGAPDD